MVNDINIGQIAEQLNNKADIDLTNTIQRASVSAKEAIVGWGIPDFESEIAISNTNNGFVYNTPSIGFLKINNNSIDAQCNAQLYKGTDATGTKIGTPFNNYIVEHGGQFNCGYTQFSLIPVGKNENYFFNSTNVSAISITFVPMKGV